MDDRARAVLEKYCGGYKARGPFRKARSRARPRYARAHSVAAERRPETCRLPTDLRLDRLSMPVPKGLPKMVCSGGPQKKCNTHMRQLNIIGLLCCRSELGQVILKQVKDFIYTDSLPEGEFNSSILVQSSPLLPPRNRNSTYTNLYHLGGTKNQLGSRFCHLPRTQTNRRSQWVFQAGWIMNIIRDPAHPAQRLRNPFY